MSAQNISLLHFNFGAAQHFPPRLPASYTDVCGEIFIVF